MKQILFVNACVRPQSRTLQLTRELLKHIEGNVQEVALYDEGLAPVDLVQLTKRNELLAVDDYKAPLFKYARQFAKADEIVIAAPYWDLAFPSILRVYLEHVTIVGVTFKYSSEVIPMWLCRAKRLLYVTTAGGPIGNCNFGYDYIKSVANGFYGIQEVRCLKAENLDVFGADVTAIMDKAISEIDTVLAL